MLNGLRYCVVHNGSDREVLNIEITIGTRPEKEVCELEPFTQLPWDQIEDPVEASYRGHRFSLKQIEKNGMKNVVQKTESVLARFVVPLLILSMSGVWMWGFQLL